MGGTEYTTAITKGELAKKLNQDDVEDASFMKVKAIVTEAKSYDVLVGSTVLYPMGFTLDFWEETASYRPEWQAGDGRKASLPARFIRVLTGNFADLFAFSGLVDAESPWFMETFDENAFATHLHMQVDGQVSAQNLESIKVHQPGVEAAWSTTTQLREATELVVQEAWQESLLPREEEGSDGTEDHGPPLDNSTIHWKPLDDGIVLLELFGGIGTGLAAVLQAGIKVQRYVYVDTDDAAQQVAKHHSRGLRAWFPKLLTTTAILSAFSSLTGNISLISEKDLHWLGHVDLVIAGWPCQGMSMTGNQNGLQDGRSSRFYDMVCVICYLQTSQRRPLGYIVENVPVVSSSRSRTLESMHKIHGILGVPVLIDVAVVGSRAHHPRFWWTNLAPAKLLQSAIGRTRQPDVYVSDILDLHQTPRRVYHDDQASLAVVNRKGEPCRAFPTLVSFARSYAFKDNGPGLIWDSITQEMVEPNADERERAMGFPTSTTNVHGISEQQRRFLLGQAMDLNCLTWVVSLVVAEQRRLASTLIEHMGFYELRSAMEPPHLVT
jgi:hypothetical protein